MSKESVVAYVEVNRVKLAGFEVLTPVVMKSTDFWDITPPCSPLKVNRRFEE
jgi:hypothetical protein